MHYSVRQGDYSIQLTFPRPAVMLVQREVQHWRNSEGNSAQESYAGRMEFLALQVRCH